VGGGLRGRSKQREKKLPKEKNRRPSFVEGGEVLFKAVGKGIWGKHSIPENRFHKGDKGTSYHAGKEGNKTQTFGGSY